MKSKELLAVSLILLLVFGCSGSDNQVEREEKLIFDAGFYPDLASLLATNLGVEPETMSVKDLDLTFRSDGALVSGWIEARGLDESRNTQHGLLRVTDGKWTSEMLSPYGSPHEFTQAPALFAALDAVQWEEVMDRLGHPPQVSVMTGITKKCLVEVHGLSASATDPTVLRSAVQVQIDTCR